jgi:hypothetical protein
MQFIGAIGERNVFTTPETNLELAKSALGKITTEDCQKAFNEFWDTKDLSLVLTTPAAPDSAAEDLKTIFLKSGATEVTAPTEKALIPFSYTDFRGARNRCAGDQN